MSGGETLEEQILDRAACEKSGKKDDGRRKGRSKEEEGLDKVTEGKIRAADSKKKVL